MKRKIRTFYYLFAFSPFLIFFFVDKESFCVLFMTSGAKNIFNRKTGMFI